MWNKINKGFFELLKTLSSRVSFFSSKRIERMLFTSVSIGAVITCLCYEVKHDKLTATETTILITPLLLAAGYTLGKTEAAKKSDNTDKKDGEV